jgi:hypothetical protein
MNRQLSRKDFLRVTLSLAAGSLGAAACADDDEDVTAAAVGGFGGTPGTGGMGGDAGPGGMGGQPGGMGGQPGGMGGVGGGGIEECTETIAANHPPVEGEHILEVPEADVMAGAQMTYSIQGNSAHDHTITLTVADMETLADGGSVTVTSTTELAHSHDVTVVCA